MDFGYQALWFRRACGQPVDACLRSFAELLGIHGLSIRPDLFCAALEARYPLRYQWPTCSAALWLLFFAYR